MTETSPPPPEAPRRVTRSGPRIIIDSGILILAAVLAIVSGAAGALLTLYVRPQTPPPRFAVIDVTRLAQAAKSTGGDSWATNFPARLEYAIGQLQQSDPNRVLLVKEAVIGNSAEDLTDMLLPIAFTSDQRQPATASPQAPTPLEGDRQSRPSPPSSAR